MAATYPFRERDDPPARRTCPVGEGCLRIVAARQGASLQDSSMPSLLRRRHIPSPLPTMLWSYKLNFTGYIEAPSDLAEARQKLAEKMSADPFAYISSLTPMEPSCRTVG